MQRQAYISTENIRFLSKPIKRQRALNENVIGLRKRFKFIADRYRNRHQRLE